MPRLTLHYPDGVAGAALLLMRLSSAMILVPALARLWRTPESGWMVAIPTIILALAMVLGFGTRVAALMLIVALAADLFAASGEEIFLLLGSGGGAGALLLLGPGAYSIDAHRFGRKVIRLEPRSPDRGSER